MLSTNNNKTVSISFFLFFFGWYSTHIAFSININEQKKTPKKNHKGREMLEITPGCIYKLIKKETNEQTIVGTHSKICVCVCLSCCFFLSSEQNRTYMIFLY